MNAGTFFGTSPSEVFDTFWYFAAERQNVFFRRLSGMTPPWTDDPILQRYKFTNAYRAADRVSQYLIKHVIYEEFLEPEDTFYRIILFKLFNRIETWEYLEQRFGTVHWGEPVLGRVEDAIGSLVASGQPVYSAAYIMPTAGRRSNYRHKFQTHVNLVREMMYDNVAQRIGQLKHMRDAFLLLRSYAGIGDFLAYQYVTDINYSTITDFTETEFVCPGPGALEGISRCFPKLGRQSQTDIIRMVYETQDQEFSRRGIQFKSLWGRSLQLIDCQNLFCEVAKYARVRHPGLGDDSNKGRKRIKQRFQPRPDGIPYWFPPKWSLNEYIREEDISGCV